MASVIIVLWSKFCFDTFEFILKWPKL